MPNQLMTTPLCGHILVAEDNLSNQLLMEMVLERFGLTCDIANDGLEAVQMYDPTLHSLILMDENMPNMSGSEAMKVIRDKHQERCGSIIAVTANALNGDRERFLELGMDDYISKPISLSVLYKVLENSLLRV